MTDIFCVKNTSRPGIANEWVLYLGTKNPSPRHALDTWDRESGGLAVVFYVAPGCLGTHHWTHKIIGAPWYREVNSHFLLQDNKKWVTIIDSFRQERSRDMAIYQFKDFIKELEMEEIPFRVARWEENSFAQGHYGEVTVCG